MSMVQTQSNCFPACINSIHMSALPSLSALRCFDASARSGSFTRAAREVHLTQGAVSHQVIGLEDMLGVPLFVRKRSGLELTAAGRAYHQQISMALRQIERATQEMVTNKGRGGTLELSVASSFASYWLMPRLSAFVAAHPEVTLNLATKIGPVDFVGSTRDASIEFCLGAQGEIHADRVLELTLYPCAASSVVRKYTRGRPLDSRGLRALLRNEPLIRHTTVPQAWIQWLGAAGLADAVEAHALASGPVYDLLSMALNGAMTGIGVALLPEYVARTALESGQLTRLSSTGWTAEQAYFFRYPAWKRDLAALQTFRSWLLGALQAPDERA